ncbi:hypothetical protein [Candidatus Endomicrobiellum agilis]|uniref:hypothetical protein n=1 Tax=Candidatus Endomicrobiellum agilis TaxID=3238957 RepID=UPI003578F218|nr:hypothetical protein [Endomicrobium sp.]
MNVQSHANSFGDTRASELMIVDNYVNINSYADIFGNIGNKYTNTNSYADTFGNLRTAGSIGNDYMNTNSYIDTFGNTRTSSRIEDEYIKSMLIQTLLEV